MNANIVGLGPSAIWTLKYKIGELVENAHGLKDGSLVIRQENISELVEAVVAADRVEILAAHDSDPENPLRKRLREIRETLIINRDRVGVPYFVDSLLKDYWNEHE